MSKIDVSDEDRVVEFSPKVFTVVFKKKEIGFFSSRVGALEYLEVLKRGEKERSDNSNKAEVVS